MKRQHTRFVLSALSVFVICSLVGVIFAYFTGSKSRDNTFTTAEPVQDTIYHRINYQVEENGKNVDKTLVFDTTHFPMYQGEKFYTNFYDGYVPTDNEIASGHSVPNGFFLNAYHYDVNDNKIVDGAETCQFINAQKTYDNIFNGMKNIPLTYPRMIGSSVTDAALGLNEKGTAYGGAQTYTQGEETLEFYYEYEPIDYRITFDLNYDFMPNALGHPEFIKTDSALNAMAIYPDNTSKANDTAGSNFTKNYTGSYNVLHGQVFPDLHWVNQNGIQYVFKGWKIVSDDHYDPETDEYTNYNFKERKDNDGNVISIDDNDYVYGINCWVEDNDPTAFYKFDRRSFHSYKAGEDDENNIIYNPPVDLLTTQGANTPEDDPVYSYEELMKLLSKRSIGNIVVEAQWEIPDLVITFDTQYIQSKYENGGYINKLTYRWDYSLNRHVLRTDGEYADQKYMEPLFNYTATYKDPNYTITSKKDEDDKDITEGTYTFPNRLSPLPIAKVPYSEFWTTESNLRVDSDADADVSADPALVLKYNTKRNGIVQYEDGGRAEPEYLDIEEALYAYKYPVADTTNLEHNVQTKDKSYEQLSAEDKAKIERYYAFMKETVYDGSTLTIDVQALGDKVHIVTENGAVKQYEVTLYGYIRPAVTIHSKKTVTTNNLSYHNSTVQFDYFGVNDSIGNNINLDFASFEDHFMNNHFDPRISEQQTFDRGYTNNYAQKAGTAALERGKSYMLPTVSGYRFDGWRTYAQDSGENEYLTSKIATLSQSTYATLNHFDIISGEISSGFIRGNNFSAISNNGDFKLGRTDNHKYCMISNMNVDSLHKIYVRPIWTNTTAAITIHFMANGGIGSMYDNTVKTDNTSIPNCVFTRYGYDFTEWTATSNGNSASGGKKVKAFSDIVAMKNNKNEVWLWANWEQSNFIVEFKKNLPDTDPNNYVKLVAQADYEQIIYTAGANAGAPLEVNKFGDKVNRPENQGYTYGNMAYIGWNTKPDGTGDWYTSGKTVSETDRNLVRKEIDGKSKKVLTLYAMWSSQSIMFDANGGYFEKEDVTTNQVFYANNAPTRLTSESERVGVYKVPAKDGYAFAGWRREGTTSTSTIIDNETGILSVSIYDSSYMGRTLYAVWEKIDIPVYFHPNGGAGNITQERITTESGGKLTLKTQEVLNTMSPAQGFHKDGYVLVGWSLTSQELQAGEEPFAADGSTIAYTDVIKELRQIYGIQDMKPDSVVLYAVWAKQQDITFDPNTAQGGSGDVYTLKTNQYGKLQIPDNTGTAEGTKTFTNGNKVLLGWSDKPNPWKDSTAQIYKIGDTISFYDEKTLYAQWYYYAENFESESESTVVTLHDDVQRSIFTDDSQYLDLRTKSGGDVRFADVAFKKIPDFNYQPSYVIEFSVKMNVANSDRAQTFQLATSNASGISTISGDYLVRLVTGNTKNSTLSTINEGTDTVDTGDWTNIMVVVTGNTAISYIGDEVYTHTFSGDPIYGINALVGRGTNSGYVEVDNIKVYSTGTMLTFNAAGGTGTSPETVFLMPGETYTLPTTCPYTKAGYTFGGWVISGADEVITEYTSDGSGAVIIVPKWIATPHYEVTFDGNSGSGDRIVLATANLDETTVTAPDNSYLRTGYTFAGWAVSADGTAKYQPDETITLSDLTWTETDGSKYATLYAVWNEVKYKVSYDANGGTGDMNDSETTGGKVTIAENGFTRDGYKFMGWSASGDGDVETRYAPGTEINLNEDLQLFAVWTEVGMKIVYNANGGTGEMTADGLSTTMLTVRDNAFKKTNYKFMGWQDDSGVSFNTGDIVNYSDYGDTTLTLYAQWEEDWYTINYVANGEYAPGVTISGSTTSQSTLRENSITLRANGFTSSNNNMMFVVWNTSPDGTGTMYAANSSVSKITEGDSITLYAMWSRFYVYRFNANGGTFSDGTSSKDEQIYYTGVVPAGEYNDRRKGIYSNDMIPLREGYTFDGWYRGNTKVINADGIFVTQIDTNYTDKQPFTAKWIAN